jgi:hypothetical protein
MASKAISWISERRNAIKDSTPILSDLLNIVYDYLRYKEMITLGDHDMIGCVIDFDKNYSTSGLFSLHYDRCLQRYPIVLVHILDVQPKERYQDINTVTALIAQPKIEYDDETTRWYFDGDRCTNHRDKYQLRLVDIMCYRLEIYMQNILPVKQRGQIDFYENQELMEIDLYTEST